MHEIVIWQLGSAYVFAVLLSIFLRIRRVNRQKVLLINAIRMTLQLVLAGYVLTFVFENPSPWLTILVILIMESFAVFNVFQRVAMPLPRRAKYYIAFSMAVGTITSALFFLFIVIGLSPWYDPRFFIPISGMIIGNSMTGISLGAARLAEGFRDRRDMVQAALDMGATPGEATRLVSMSAFDAAITPVLNAMAGMGLVFLPGMMTGQILSGASPIAAIKYQIAIMMGIMGAVSITSFIYVYLGGRAYFDENARLLLPDEYEKS